MSSIEPEIGPSKTVYFDKTILSRSVMTDAMITVNLVCASYNHTPLYAAFSCNYRTDRNQYDATCVLVSFYKFSVNKSALLKQWPHNIRRFGFATSSFNQLGLT